jgi:DNA mismatch endonuclease (patch repair protein)
MQGNRGANTKPEVALRSALHAAGLRFRKNLRLDVGSMKVRPDVVFTRAKAAVFIDGCYWHSCPMHGRRIGGRNDDYWSAKMARNVERDHKQDQMLREAGWMVLRFWEHERPSEIALTVREALAAHATSVN